MVDPVVRGVELEVGGGPGGTAEVVDVGADDEADEAGDAGQHLVDVLPLGGQVRVVDGHEADVVGPGVEAQAPEPAGVEHPGPGPGAGARRGGGGPLADPADRRVTAEFFHATDGRSG
jgi:hypothetical protein